jgi:RNA polymerase sigma factor (sigma-70 family)
MVVPLRSVPNEPAGRPHGGGTAISFEDFFRETHTALFRALSLVTGSRQEAEDVMQVAFMKVFERWDRVAAMENPEGFLYRVAMNEFRSRYRRAKRAIRRTITAAPTDDAFEEAIEDRDVVIRALRELVPQQRAVLVLTALLDYSAEEAGEMLGMKAPTVRTLGSRARASMRKTVGDLR